MNAQLLAKIGTAGATSLVVAEAVNFEPIISALCTLAVSILSCLAVEGVGWLKSYFIKKRQENEEKDKDE